MTVLSNTDALLVGVPMIGLLLVVHFRLDELVGKPRKSRKSGRSGRKFADGEERGGLSAARELEGESWGRYDLPAMRRPRVRAERVQAELE